MSQTQGTSGFGTLLQIGDGGGTEVFTSIAEVKSITGPNLSLETIDATHMTSPSGHREVLPSFKNSGEVGFDVNFLPGVGTQQSLFTDWTNRTLRNFKLVFPDAGSTSWKFSAYVTALSISAPLDDVLGASITLTISGAVDFTGLLDLTP